MTEPSGGPRQGILYHEPGVAWTALVWAPIFALVGYFTELVTGGRQHTAAWGVVAVGLFALTVPWVLARRKFLSVRLTRSVLRQGREELAVNRIAAVADVGAPVGTRILGGGWTVPGKYDELPLRLDDGTVVLAWARNVEALQAALARLVEAGDARS